jgi:hypothetical protein
MKASKDEEHSKIFKDEAQDLSISNRSLHNEIRGNRKFINYLIRMLTQKKNLPSAVLQKECVEILQNCDRDLLMLQDEDKNNRNKILYFYYVLYFIEF